MLQCWEHEGKNRPFFSEILNYLNKLTFDK